MRLMDTIKILQKYHVACRDEIDRRGLDIDVPELRAGEYIPVEPDHKFEAYIRAKIDSARMTAPTVEQPQTVA